MTKFQTNNQRFSNRLKLAFLVLMVYGLGCISGIIITNNIPGNKTNLNENSMTVNFEKRLQEIAERQASAWENADADKIIADFAEDSLFVVPGFSFKGKQQIKEEAENYFTEFTETKIQITRVIFRENQGAMEWIWTDKNKKTGETSRAEDAIIFELEDGKIKYWREYIDKQAQEN